MHLIIDVWQILEVDGLKWSMDETSSEEIKSLGRILSVADVRSLNSDHLEHRLEDWCSNVCTSWQTDDDDGTSRPNVLSSLLEWFLVDGDQDDSVWAKTIRSGSSDILGDVAGGREVDESLPSR